MQLWLTLVALVVTFSLYFASLIFFLSFFRGVCVCVCILQYLQFCWHWHGVNANACRGEWKWQNHDGKKMEN